MSWALKDELELEKEEREKILPAGIGMALMEMSQKPIGCNKSGGQGSLSWVGPEVGWKEGW